MPRCRTLLTAAALAAAATPLAASAAAADYLGPIGRPGAGAGSLAKPRGIATGPDGRVYVTETAAGARVSVFDSAGQVERSFGLLAGASGIAVGPGGVYVVERDANRVARFTPAGTSLGTFGTKGVGNGQFQTPEDVAIQGGTVLVSSMNRFQRFTSGGLFVDGHGGSGSDPFVGLRSIATGADGSVFTTESTNHRVRRFSQNFAPETQWGEKGTLDGQLSSPSGIGVDSDSASVWVTDLGGRTVQRFGVGGQFRERLDTGPAGAPGNLLYPTDVAVDCRGTVYVVDGIAEQVQRYGAKETDVAQNLLRNGGFEDGGASCDTTKAAAGSGPGWSTGGGGATAVHYGAPGGFPARGDGDALGGGQSFLAGGPNTAQVVTEQTIDVSAQALDIDDGRRLARLSGLLGGFATQDDQARVEATYRNGASTELGRTTIGPVTAADRGGKTALLARAATATVPKGTRAITVRVTLTRQPGTTGYDDAYADHLALTLTPQRPGSAPAPAGIPAKGTPGPTTPPRSSTKGPKLTVRTVGTARAVERRRFVVRVTCSRACALSATAKQGGRTRASARRSRSTRARTIALTLSPRARAALRKVIRADGKAKVALTVMATDARGRTTTLARTLTVSG